MILDGTQAAARLWVLLAAREPIGVIFRRGPSKQVMLIKWNTQADTFELGQWLKGRVYERRSDVSPDGELLIYFRREPETTVALLDCYQQAALLHRPDTVAQGRFARFGFNRLGGL